MVHKSTSTLTTDNLLELGFVVKPHGLAGELVVHLTTNVPARTEPGAKWIINNETYIVSSAKQIGADKSKFRVSFDPRITRDHAEELGKSMIVGEALASLDSEGLFVHNLIGKPVTDGSGAILGTVNSVVSNPASDLLELHDGKLIPVVFVMEVRSDSILVSVPDGLFDL